MLFSINLSDLPILDDKNFKKQMCDLLSAAHSFSNTLVPFVVFCGVAAAAGRRKADKSQPATAETVVINHQSDENRRHSVSLCGY